MVVLLRRRVIGKMLVVDFQSHTAPCIMCDRETPKRLGIPMWNGMVLPNDWAGDWVGFTACPRCFYEQHQLTRPMEVCDFMKRARLMPKLRDGAEALAEARDG